MDRYTSRNDGRKIRDSRRDGTNNTQENDMYSTPCAVSIDLARHERMIDERDRREAALEEARVFFQLQEAA